MAPAEDDLVFWACGNEESEAARDTKGDRCREITSESRDNEG